MRFTSSEFEKIITNQSIQEYFFSSVNDAIRNQHVEASDELIHYLVNLLTIYSRSEELFEHDEEGISLKPLAFRYLDALTESAPVKRLRILQKLGDTALFITGIFPASLNRKLIDVDYYIAMGGNAYSSLSDGMRRQFRHAQTIFDELTRKFVDFVDVLDEVSERMSLISNHDIMRLYEVWLRTGSKRTKSKLQKLGINPLSGSATDFRH